MPTIVVERYAGYLRRSWLDAKKANFSVQRFVCFFIHRVKTGKKWDKKLFSLFIYPNHNILTKFTLYHLP